MHLDLNIMLFPEWPSGAADHDADGFLAEPSKAEPY